MKTTFEEIKSIDLKIFQPVDGYRYNEDSFLLVNFIKKLNKGAKIIELCSGNGIIGLSLMKKFFNCHVTFVEYDDDQYKLLLENIKVNNLTERAKAILSDYRNLDKKIYGTFDIVVANPPYRKINSGKISPYINKAKARHEIDGTINDLISISSKLLKDKGKIYLVFLAERMVELIKIMSKHKVEPKIIQFVYHNLHNTANLMLIQAIKRGKEGIKILSPIINEKKQTL